MYKELVSEPAQVYYYTNLYHILQYKSASVYNIECKLKNKQRVSLGMRLHILQMFHNVLSTVDIVCIYVGQTRSNRQLLTLPLLAANTYIPPSMFVRTGLSARITARDKSHRIVSIVE